VAQATRTSGPDRDEAFYDRVRDRFAEERDLRLGYRPEGRDQYITELQGDLAKYERDRYATTPIQRKPIDDTVEALFIGAGFSALLTAARLREIGVERIRLVERGADVGGTWYWNRYPGISCDVVAYDYMPLLDEMGYVPSRHYARGEEIYAHCQAIAHRFDLYDLAIFQTTVTACTWTEDEQLWIVGTDRGDTLRAQFLICANGTLAKPKLSRIAGMEKFKGYSFHSSRWDYGHTGADLSQLSDKVVGIIGTGASAVQIVPEVAEAAKELYVFQRTPSAIDVRDDWETDPEWADSLEPGWQAKRRAKLLEAPPSTLAFNKLAGAKEMTREDKIRAQENANIDKMMSIHRRIDEIVEDPATAAALKPWYMWMCKRPCFHNDYLGSFNRPNVHLVDTRGKGITEINERGPVFEGREYPVDLLIYATGFEVQKTGIYNQIVGRNGLEINDYYTGGMKTLLGIHSHGYPNLFVMAGLQASFQFNLTDVLQVQGDHIAACISFLREHGLHRMDVTEQAEADWVAEVVARRGRTNFNESCTPGYYNHEGEKGHRQDGIYTGGFPRYHKWMRATEEQPEQYFELA
jgi:cation diffusion facilitator CzcD-associated flavoprotein CzcO